MSANGEGSSDEPYAYDMTPILHSRYFYLPVSAAILGGLIGAVRGSRRASLRFLAENAHRPPKTIRGWYLYNKTKNYRRMAAGLQEGGLHAAKVATTALVWVGIEDGLELCGQPWAELRELGAGVGTAGIFGLVYRLPWRTARQAMWLGGIVGGAMGLLRWGPKPYLEKAAKSQSHNEGPQDPEPANGVQSRARPST